MTAVRCSACDTVFDGTPYTAEVQTHGHPECPNPVCNPTLAAKVAAAKEAEAAERANYEEWKAAREAEKKV